MSEANGGGRQAGDIFSSAFALWANAELYILGPSLTYSVTYSVTPAESWKNLSILMLGL